MQEERRRFVRRYKLCLSRRRLHVQGRQNKRRTELCNKLHRHRLRHLQAEKHLNFAAQAALHIPANKPLRVAEKYVLREGDTAFDLLEKATRCGKIPLDYQGSEDNIYNTVYVRGINNIYEFSCGPSSGWTYTVNGESPDKGCSQYVLHDGDSVEFYYVCDYTKEAVK